MRQVIVLSGKGGVGKSSISASLAIALAEKNKVVCADCDVDASDLALVFGLREKDFAEWKPVSTNEKTFLIPEKCSGCKKCVESCYFNAISWDGKKQVPVFDSMTCEGCGVCEIVCPEKAIALKKVDNAKIGYGKTGFGFEVVSAQLEAGESGSGKVVAEVKKLAMQIGKGMDLMVVDAAAGIGCPVIASVSGSDYAVMVTEPTPSGLSDLKRAWEITRHFGVKGGIVLNKHDLNEKGAKAIEKFAETQGIPVIAKIPYDKSFLDALNDLEPIIVHSPRFKKVFEEIAEAVTK